MVQGGLGNEEMQAEAMSGLRCGEARRRAGKGKASIGQRGGARRVDRPSDTKMMSTRQKPL